MGGEHPLETVEGTADDRQVVGRHPVGFQIGPQQAGEHGIDRGMAVQHRLGGDGGEGPVQRGEEPGVGVAAGQVDHPLGHRILGGGQRQRRPGGHERAPAPLARDQPSLPQDAVGGGHRIGGEAELGGQGPYRFQPGARGQDAGPDPLLQPGHQVGGGAHRRSHWTPRGTAPTVGRAMH